MRRALLLVTLVLLAAPQAAAAEGQRPREACRADFERLCKGIKPGEGRIKDCIKAHRAEISAQCRSALRGARAERRQSAKAK